MKLLLDTHLLLWWLSDSPLLPARARALIADPGNTVFVSAASLWEIRLKQSLDQLRLPADFEKRLASEPFDALPLTAAHTRGILDLEWRHRDPFDRMLIAQSRAEGLTLLTSDAAVAGYGDCVVRV